MEVSLCKGDSGPYGGCVQRPHRVSKGQVRVNGSEAAEVMNPDQQGGGLAHGFHIQLPGEHRKQDVFLKIICVDVNWQCGQEQILPAHGVN